jgi:antitoxin PrlF
MKEFLSVVTRKGQVTIPVEVRHRLGLKEGDKVAFVVEEDQVRVERSGSVVARTAGALKSEAPQPLPEEERSRRLLRM